MLSPTDGWIAGGGGWGTEQGATTGILLHYQGGNMDLRGDADSGWHPQPGDGVVDQGVGHWPRAVLRYDGTHWSVFQRLQGVSGISMGSATDGWAFGGVLAPENPTSAYSAVWHYDGRQWAQEALPSAVTHNAQITALAMDSAGDGWAVGQVGGLAKGTRSQTLYLHYTIGQWTQAHGPDTRELNAIFLLSAQVGWAVGVDGALIHFQNGVWSQT
jgi:hypothetical protein